MAEMDDVKVYRLYTTTQTRVELLTRAVNEGKCLDEAREFCQYLIWSGILTFLENNPIAPPLIVFGVPLHKLVADLQYNVQSQWAKTNTQPRKYLSTMEEMKAQIDLLTAKATRKRKKKAAKAPVLKILPGGAQ